MSRPYRISVTESLRRVVRSEDSVSSNLQLLPILEADELAELLAAELQSQGFRKEGQVWKRQQGPNEVTVDPATGEVTVTVVARKELNLEAKKTGDTFDRTAREQLKEQLRDSLASELNREADQEQDRLDVQVAEQMEGVLRELQPELDRIVNRATAAALKIKAGRMGAVKEISENDEDGSLTIVVEV